MKKILSLSLMFLILLTVAACQRGANIINMNTSSNTQLPDQAKEKSVFDAKTYRFFDEAVQNNAEEYLKKKYSELNAKDYEKLSKLTCFVVTKSISDFRDFQYLFPNLKYLNVWVDGALSEEDCDILENIKTLKAVTISASSFPSMEFTKKLSYVELSYNTDDNSSASLARFSVLGEKFIHEKMNGRIDKYIRVTDNNYIYELASRTTSPDPDTTTITRKVFVSENVKDNLVCKSVLDCTGNVGGFDDDNEIGEALSNRIYLADVNFDGITDVLVDNGQFGNQGLVNFTCFLNNSGQFEKCKSFSTIANPSVDLKNKKILSTWRNCAASHSWAMYSFENSEYIMTYCLTEEPVENQTTQTGEEIWQYTVEKLVGKDLIKIAHYQTNEDSVKQINEKIFEEGSFWELNSDKWYTIFNRGRINDYSIYDNDDINSTIYEIINQ